jgi:hypothetical protein
MLRTHVREDFADLGLTAVPLLISGGIVKRSV